MNLIVVWRAQQNFQTKILKQKESHKPLETNFQVENQIKKYLKYFWKI